MPQSSIKLTLVRVGCESRKQTRFGRACLTNKSANLGGRRVLNAINLF